MALTEMLMTVKAVKIQQKIHNYHEEDFVKIVSKQKLNKKGNNLSNEYKKQN